VIGDRNSGAVPVHRELDHFSMPRHQASTFGHIFSHLNG
jgi:hypothetical protein